MNITRHFFVFIFLVLALSACSDNNYKGDNYVSYDSMDELVLQVVESIKSKDDKKLLHLLDNQAITLDALFAANSPTANQLKARLQTPQGQKELEREQLNQKIKIQTFFTIGLDKQIPPPLSRLKMTGFEVVSNKPYAENSPAWQQEYNVVLDDQLGNYYHYKITVIQWEQKFHLIEAAGFLDKQ